MFLSFFRKFSKIIITWISWTLKYEANNYDTTSMSVRYCFEMRNAQIVKNTLYRKPTDTYNYVLFNSAHPLPCKSAIPYSQFLRMHIITHSQREAYMVWEEEVEADTNYLRNRKQCKNYGYSQQSRSISKIVCND